MQKLINVGSVPNGDAGDPIRVAFNKCNDNFSELFKTSLKSSGVFDSNSSPNEKVISFTVDGVVYYIQAKTTKD